MFPTLFQMTKLRQQPPIPGLATVQTSLVSENNLYWVWERGEGGLEDGDDLRVSEDIEQPPCVLTVLQGPPLVLGQAGVLQVPVVKDTLYGYLNCFCHRIEVLDTRAQFGACNI